MRLTRRPLEAVAIDIAPLVDVVFQLLLFFMLTSSFVLHPAIRVTLPEATTKQRLSASNLVITLTKDHVLYWGEELVTFNELHRRLTGAARHKPVLIRADRHAYVDKLLKLWDLCRDAGYREIHIATLSE